MPGRRGLQQKGVGGWGNPREDRTCCSTLTSTLLDHGLVDEVVLAVYPLLLGTGKRFFADGTPARSFALVSTQAMPSGIILSTYKVTGPLKAGWFDNATLPVTTGSTVDGDLQ